MNKIELNETQQKKIEDWVLECYPEEMCGFLTETDFFPVKNISETPEESFKIDALESVKYLPICTAIVHSHTLKVTSAGRIDPRVPSEADKTGQKVTGKPWLIVASEGTTVSKPLQTPRVPSREYIGRQFNWYVDDCYSLVQDYYLFELGITLPEALPMGYHHARQLEKTVPTVIADYGFYEVKLQDIQDNDILMLNYGMARGNHLGIYINGTVLHQGEDLSVQVPMSTFIGRISKVLRYGEN